MTHDTDAVKDRSQRAPDSEQRSEGDRTLVDVHENIDRDGVIVELRPKEHVYPEERDMEHLSESEARELYDQLASYLTDTDQDNDGLTVADLSLRATDEGPVLDINGELSVLLRTFVEMDRGEELHSGTDDVDTAVEHDGDNGSWWTASPGDGFWPRVSIQPEVSEVPDA